MTQKQRKILFRIGSVLIGVGLAFIVFGLGLGVKWLLTGLDDGGGHAPSQWNVNRR